MAADLAERLREAGDDAGAQEVEELRARIVELEAALSTTLGSMEFPGQEQRRIMREVFSIDYDVAPNAPGQNDKRETSKEGMSHVPIADPSVP